MSLKGLRQEMGPRPTPRRFTDTEIAELRRLDLEGKSIRQIAKTLGRAASSVRIKIIELAIKDEIAEHGGKFRWKGWRPTAPWSEQ